jgi:integrase
MAVRHRPGKRRRDRYIVDLVDQTGQRRWVTFFGTKKQALEREAQIRVEMGQGEFQTRAEQTTFDELVEAYLTGRLVKVREATAKEYEDEIRRHLLPYFTGRRLRAISMRDVEDFRAHMRAQGVKGLPIKGREDAKRTFGHHTVNKVLRLASMMFGYAQRHGWMTMNPAKVERLRDDAPKHDDVRENVLDESEAQRLIAAADGPCRTLIKTALYTGLRQSELLGLRWGDIDLEVGELHVRRVYREGRFYNPKTRTSRRAVPLNEDLLLELKHWKLACPIGPRANPEAAKDQERDLDLVFPNSAGKPQNKSNLLTRGFYPAVRRAKLRSIGFHGLRHTFASVLIANGASIKTVCTLMGHSSIKITADTYGHMFEAEGREAVRLLSRAFGSSKFVADSETKAAAGDATSQGLKQKGDFGVADGTRTHDNRNHNPGLYQLSYGHRRGRIIAQRV